MTTGWTGEPRPHEQLDPPPEQKSCARWTLPARVSFAGTTYRAGNRSIGHVVGVRVVGDTVQIAQNGLLLRTHRARHDKLKEFGALNNPGGRPRRSREDVA